MSLLRCAVVLSLVWIIAAAPLAALQPDDGLAELRAKATLTEIDRSAIQTWIGQRVVTIVGNDPAGAQQAFAQMRDGVRGTSDFQQVYVAGCIRSIASAYKKATLAPAARLIAILNVLNDLGSLDVLLEALQDDRTAIRAAAAVALRNLQPKLVGNADLFGRTLNALRDVGQREASSKTLQLIYLAMDYSGSQAAADTKASATAVLTVLEERVKQLSDQNVRAEGADYVGLQVAGRLRAGRDETVRRRYTSILGQMLQYGVRRYTAGGKDALIGVDSKTGSADLISLRNNIELLIVESEQQLKRILSPDNAPEITEKMKEADGTNMVNEMNRWAALLRGSTGLDLSMQGLPEEEAKGEEP